MEKVEILRITLYLVVPRWMFFKDEILIHYFSNITDEFILLVNSMIKVVHLLTSFKVKILLQHQQQLCYSLSPEISGLKNHW